MRSLKAFAANAFVLAKISVPRELSRVYFRAYPVLRNPDADMIKTGFNKETFRSNLWMDKLLRKGETQKAKKWFDEMSLKNTISTNTMISGYIKEGKLREARELFDRMIERSTVSWTIIISGYAQSGLARQSFELFSKMRQFGEKPDHITLVSLLSACVKIASFDLLIQVHAVIVKLGFEIITLVSNSLIDSYCKCGSLSDARWLFDKMPDRDSVSFNSVITGYSKNGTFEQTIELFLEMLNLNLRPSQFTFVGVLSAAIGMDNLSLGQQIHCFITKYNSDGNVFVNNALLDLYSKSCLLNDVKKLFDEMPERDIVSYNAIIKGSAWSGDITESLHLFRKLQFINFDRRQFPFSSMLSLAGSLSNLRMGKEIHAQVIFSSANSDIFVTNSLIDMYAKCGQLVEAEQIFVNLEESNSISWTAMITGYVQNGFFEESVKLFFEMRRNGFSSDPATFSSILKASSNLSSLGLGKQLHSYVIRLGFLSSVFAGCALLDMYAKCGCIEEAAQTFNEMPSCNLVSWNAMISAYAQNGYGKFALKLFDKMIDSGTEPDRVTFMGILSACNHGGLVEEGLKHFNNMRKIYLLEPEKGHYACMIDNLARVGRLDEAKDMLLEMPFEADCIIWSSILNACKIHANTELAQEAANKLFNMELKDAAPYVIMSNIYARAGQWGNVLDVKKLMKERGVKKEPAYSWVEVKNKIYSFQANDDGNPQTNEIKEMLDNLSRKMEKEGYRPDTSCSHQNVDEDMKAESLKYHSERLAVAFALINTPHGSPIRVMKNLRACTDCHTVIKLISKIAGREITVRDSSRFHHFRNGMCSCGDYW